MIAPKPYIKLADGTKLPSALFFVLLVLACLGVLFGPNIGKFGVYAALIILLLALLEYVRFARNDLQREKRFHRTL